ncbi:YbaK/EbsC family protein [Vibrio hannami]|uniref:aminoacyl-tRNA deacylase n=1 Tax=Vibrio hannami TaxID=2717094 RepID=UPI00240F1401|nr:YbaK/EbsC family protein [Vibrio hannami]MDG3087585.1 YbaK/EbsC family protein [Vibrio hannami]
MTIATRVENYLNDNQIPFQTVIHEHSQSSLHSAVKAHVPKMNIAKGIVLEDHEGRHLLAVLPADSKISISELNVKLHADFHLLKEQQVYHLFEDCEHGAVPPIGTPYHISMICEESLIDLEEVYLEGGDHETLIKLDRAGFHKAMSEGKWLHFSSQVFH